MESILSTLSNDAESNEEENRPLAIFFFDVSLCDLIDKEVTRRVISSLYSLQQQQSSSLLLSFVAQRSVPELLLASPSSPFHPSVPYPDVQAYEDLVFTPTPTSLFHVHLVLKQLQFLLNTASCAVHTAPLSSGTAMDLQGQIALQYEQEGEVIEEKYVFVTAEEAVTVTRMNV